MWWLLVCKKQMEQMEGKPSYLPCRRGKPSEQLEHAEQQAGPIEL